MVPFIFCRFRFLLTKLLSKESKRSGRANMSCISVQCLQLFPSNFPANSQGNHFKSFKNFCFKLDTSAVTLRISTSCNRVASSKGVSVRAEESSPEPEEIISGEWPENFSLLNYDDLIAYLEPEIFKDKMDPATLLGEVMSTVVRTATVDQTLEEIDHHFEIVSGLPVIDDEFRCIGVISKTDKQRASLGLTSKVSEVMSSPAITSLPDKTVLDAAAVMLKEKIHRIPIVNEEGQVVGIVTRRDIFRALEGLPA
ncbi:uncharacterized protein YtoI-like [Macadamia integrifolia]|uniref:uncharacterized protein YtoI-like n=1 Tax=Macadamia integrifolia TaxID=60698 RepID=UPI001C500B0E|nr:uncharacterized protein YtoI-like [Macadamia integrifolia]